MDWYADCSYHAERKRRFHATARARLRQLVAELRLPAGRFDLRSNQGGIAVSGEITLHGEQIYVQVCQPATLFDALAAAGITSVAVNFDGYGDSGQIESIDALAGAEAVSLPDTLVEIAGLAWGEPEARTPLLSLRAAIEELAYDFLGQTHGGWPDGDGAYGDFTFDVEQRSISLDYNERYSATENYVHEF